MVIVNDNALIPLIRQWFRNNKAIMCHKNCKSWDRHIIGFVAVVVLLFYVHGKQLRSCRDGQLT